MDRSPSFPPKTSPGLQWGSPALRPAATFPPMNKGPFVPNDACTTNTPPHRPPNSTNRWGGKSFEYGRGSGSPQVIRGPFQNSFRTPQPQQRHNSPNGPRPPWTDNRGNQRNRFSSNQSPRGSPNVNPGGSDDITQYYSPCMVVDPWLQVQPQPVGYWQNS